jgi:hypothetical protein
VRQRPLTWWKVLIRDVIIPLGGLALIFTQVFMPGERLGLIAAGLGMMGLPAVAYGARALDQAEAEKADR